MLLEQIHLEADERVVRIIRKHWFVIATELASLAALALIPLVPLVLERTLTLLPADTLPALARLAPYYVFGSALWLLLVLMMAAAAWTHYYLDLWVVTTRRVVLIDQRGFFRRFVSSFRLERLQDMNHEINGLIPTFLNFGTIEAQTAGGSNEQFRSAFMPDPQGIKALIISLADELTTAQAARVGSLKDQGL